VRREGEGWSGTDKLFSAPTSPLLTLQVLYRIEGSVVSIAVVGLKRGNTLIVRGEGFAL